MALGPLTGSIPPGLVGTPYTYQIQQSDVLFVFTSFYGSAANLPPYTFVDMQSPPYAPGLVVANFLTGLAIPGMSMTSSGLMFGTPTVAGNYVPICMPQSQPNPSPPPVDYSVDTIIVNGWAVLAPGNRSYPIF